MSGEIRIGFSLLRESKLDEGDDDADDKDDDGMLFLFRDLCFDLLLLLLWALDINFLAMGAKSTGDTFGPKSVPGSEK